MRGDRSVLGGLRWRWLPGDAFPALSQRRLAGVERRSRATVAARTELRGADHPGTLSARFAVVRSLHAQRRYEEAESEGRILLSDCRRVLGSGHRQTVDAHVDVANALKARGLDAEAELELRAAVDVLDSAPNTDAAAANIRLSLAVTLCVQGHFEEAFSLCRDVIAADERAGAGQHRITGMYVLANCHNIAGRFSEAESTARAVLDGLPRLRTDRRGHAMAARAQHDLAVALFGLGRYRDAETAIRMSLAAARPANVTAPFLLVAHATAADVLIRGREYEMAEIHARDAVRAIRYPEIEHPVGCHARVVLAAALRGGRRDPDAEAQLRPVLDTLPHGHRTVLRARTELAKTLRAQERHAEAGDEARTAATGYRRLFGPDHPSTLAARAESAEVLAALGRHDEARAELSSVLQARRHVLGPDHPDTVAGRERLRRMETG